MGPHATWFDFIPGFGAFRDNLQESLGRTWTWQVFQTTHFQLDHVMGALVVLAFLALGAFRYRTAVSGAGDAGLVPSAKLGMRNLFEVLADTVLGLMAGVIGEKPARKYLPLVGTLFLFILFSNLLGLIPGFLPPSSTLKTNFAMSVLVFLLTHVFGVRENGIKYFKHFLGPDFPLPFWKKRFPHGLPILAPLMLPIELISHIARPVSLAMRLMGNIVGDHTLVAVFFGIAPFLLPLPFMVMGVLVCVVQAIVFSLLTTVYIGQAVSHEDH